eukprot:gene23365-biopygen8859
MRSIFVCGQLTVGPIWSDLAGLGWAKAGSDSVRWGRTEVGGAELGGAGLDKVRSKGKVWVDGWCGVARCKIEPSHFGLCWFWLCCDRCDFVCVGWFACIFRHMRRRRGNRTLARVWRGHGAGVTRACPVPPGAAEMLNK